MQSDATSDLWTVLATLVRVEDERPSYVDEYDPYAAEILARLAASLACRAFVSGRCAGKTLAKAAVDGFSLDVVEVDCPPTFVIGVLRWSNGEQVDAFPWVGEDGLSIAPSRMTAIGLTFGDLILLEKSAHATLDAAELLARRKGCHGQYAAIPWNDGQTEAADVAAKDGEETC